MLFPNPWSKRPLMRFNYTYRRWTDCSNVPCRNRNWITEVIYRIRLAKCFACNFFGTTMNLCWRHAPCKYINMCVWFIWLGRCCVIPVRMLNDRFLRIYVYTRYTHKPTAEPQIGFETFFFCAQERRELLLRTPYAHPCTIRVLERRIGEIPEEPFWIVDTYLC
jgi:hypothetical protein